MEVVMMFIFVVMECFFVQFMEVLENLIFIIKLEVMSILEMLKEEVCQEGCQEGCQWECVFYLLKMVVKFL